jgi:hypothetical protein
MKKITSPRYRNAAERRIPLKASTGSHCPANGFWRPEDGPATEPVFVFEGSIMPSGKRGSTMWYLDDTQVGPPVPLVPGMN